MAKPERRSIWLIIIMISEYCAPLVKRVTRICLENLQLYQEKNEANSASINYIANNNGFTLNDLCSFDRKHNELNGENN